MITLPRLDFYALIFLLFSFLVPDETWELIALFVSVFFVLLSVFHSIHSEYRKRRAQKVIMNFVTNLYQNRSHKEENDHA